MAKILIGQYDGSIYQVKDKLREAVADLEAGVTTDVKYTVEDAVSDFLAKGLKGGRKEPSIATDHWRTTT
jgi:hypothetical protein